MGTIETNLLHQTSTNIPISEVSELISLTQTIDKWIISSQKSSQGHSDPRSIVHDGKIINRFIPHHFFADKEKDRLFMKAWHILLVKGKVKQVDVSHKSQKISYSITSSNVSPTNLQYVLEAFQKPALYSLKVHK